MCKIEYFNKRRQSPFIYKVGFINFNLIYTLITVKYSEENYSRLKKESEFNSHMPDISEVWQGGIGLLKTGCTGILMSHSKRTTAGREN